MKHFLTFTQRKILKDYWREQTPFTLGVLPLDLEGERLKVHAVVYKQLS